MLEGKKIKLRLIEEKDIPRMLALMNDLNHRGEFLGIDVYHETKIQKPYADAGFWENDFGRMLITDKDDSILGAITYFKGIGDSEGYEIGCQIYRKEDRGKGYSTEAIKIFCAYMFALKPIQRLQVCTASGNVTARKVAEKCGFVYEGTMRKALFVRGEYHDLDFLSMLRDESPLLSEVLESMRG